MLLTADFVIFSVALTFNVVLCVLLARWYVWPAIVARPRREALILLLLPHTIRFLNLAAATASQVDPRIPHAWALQIAWGDFAAALLALTAIAALRSGGGIGLAWLATVVGLLDFCNSMSQGVLLHVTDLPLGFVWYIAAGVVVPLFTAHVLAVRVLLKRDA